MSIKHAPMSKWLGPIVGPIVAAILGYGAGNRIDDPGVSMSAMVIGGAIAGEVAGIVMFLIDLKRRGG